MTNNKITPTEYILQQLSQSDRQNIDELAEGYAMIRQAGRASKTRRGYATAISNAVSNLVKAGKIKMLNFWDMQYTPGQ